MTSFLLFTSYAPLASWGDIAVGEARGSWDRPSRSAVLGLVAAALGIERTDQAAHDALDIGYGIGVRLDAPGVPLIDYHTAQTVGMSAVKRHAPSTRAELLAAGNHETILSRRMNRANALATVALWVRDAEARWSLARVCDALHRPVFAVFAGRKANAFGLPLGPTVLEADTLRDAFHMYAGARGMRSDAPENARRAIAEVFGRLRPRHGWGREVAFDEPGTMRSGVEVERRDIRRDSAAERTRWQFAERSVMVGTLPLTQDAGSEAAR